MVNAEEMDSSPFDQPYRGGFVGKQHRFALTVFFEDTDTAGIVYYANYFKFMERARSDMLRAAGIDQRAAKEDGTGVYAVAEVGICRGERNAVPANSTHVDRQPSKNTRFINHHLVSHLSFSPEGAGRGEGQWRHTTIVDVGSRRRAGNRL